MTASMRAVVLGCLCHLMLSLVASEPATIGLLVFGPHNQPTMRGLQDALRERGLSVRYLHPEVIDRRQDLAPAMRAIMAGQPDLIFTSTTPATLEAKRQAGSVPVLFAPVQDPMAAGLVAIIARPGGTCTGIMLTDSTAKQLEWMLRISPTSRRILLPYSADGPSSLLSLRKAQAAAELFQVQLRAWPVRSQADIDALLADCPRDLDAIFLPRDGRVMARVDDFAALAQERDWAMSGTRLEMVQSGALLGFGFDGYEVGRQAGRLAWEILHGADPALLPVETAEDYLAINMVTARALGLEIPPSILRQAHVLIHQEPAADAGSAP